MLMDENWQVLEQVVVVWEQVLVVWERVWEQVLEVLALVLVQGWEPGGGSCCFFLKFGSDFLTKWVKIYPDENCKSSAGRNFTTMGRPSSRTRTAFSLGVCRGGVDVLGLLRKK